MSNNIGSRDQTNEKPRIKLESMEKIRKELFQQEKDFENTLAKNKLSETQDEKVTDYFKDSEPVPTDPLVIDRQESM